MSLSQESGTEPSAVLAKMITERNAEKVIFKLRSLEETIEPASAAKLAVAIARNASRYPDPKGFMSFHTPLKQAAMHISQLLRKVPAELRGPLSLEIISEAETLRFACECARWLSTADDSKRGRILSLAEEQVMRTTLGERIEKHCNILPMPIYLSEPQNAGTYLINWCLYSGADGPRDYLSKQIANDPVSISEVTAVRLDLE